MERDRSDLPSRPYRFDKELSSGDRVFHRDDDMPSRIWRT